MAMFIVRGIALGVAAIGGYILVQSQKQKVKERNIRKKNECIICEGAKREPLKMLHCGHQVHEECYTMYAVSKSHKGGDLYAFDLNGVGCPFRDCRFHVKIPSP